MLLRLCWLSGGREKEEEKLKWELSKMEHKYVLASPLLSGAWCWLGKQRGCHPKGTNTRFHLEFEFVWITLLHGFSCIHKSMSVSAEAASQAWKGSQDSASFQSAFFVPICLVFQELKQCLLYLMALFLVLYRTHITREPELLITNISAENGPSLCVVGLLSITLLPWRLSCLWALELAGRGWSYRDKGNV